MNKLQAIRLAIIALRNEIKDKSWDADHGLGVYADRCRIYVKERQEAIEKLEEMRDEKKILYGN
jgi:hypothetical protein